LLIFQRRASPDQQEYAAFLKFLAQIIEPLSVVEQRVFQRKVGQLGVPIAGVGSSISAERFYVFNAAPLTSPATRDHRKIHSDYRPKLKKNGQSFQQGMFPGFQLFKNPAVKAEAMTIPGFMKARARVFISLRSQVSELLLPAEGFRVAEGALDVPVHSTLYNFFFHRRLFTNLLLRLIVPQPVYRRNIVQ